MFALKRQDWEAAYSILVPSGEYYRLPMVKKIQGLHLMQDPLAVPDLLNNTLLAKFVNLKKNFIVG